MVPGNGDVVELEMVKRIKQALEDVDDPHHEYLHALQTRSEFNDHPVMWSEERLQEELGGTILHDVFKATVGQWFRKGLLNDDPATRFATAVMLSRCFEHEEVKLALVPFADQFNHSSDSWHTKIREDGERGFLMFAERNIHAGEQIFNFYGPHSDSWLLLTHGFTEASNPFNDEIMLPSDDQVKSVSLADIPDDIDFADLRCRLDKLYTSTARNTFIRDLEIATLTRILDKQ